MPLRKANVHVQRMTEPLLKVRFDDRDIMGTDKQQYKWNNSHQKLKPKCSENLREIIMRMLYIVTQLPPSMKCEELDNKAKETAQTGKQ